MCQVGCHSGQPGPEEWPNTTVQLHPHSAGLLPHEQLLPPARDLLVPAQASTPTAPVFSSTSRACKWLPFSSRDCTCQLKDDGFSSLSSCLPAYFLSPCPAVFPHAKTCNGTFPALQSNSSHASHHRLHALQLACPFVSSRHAAFLSRVVVPRLCQGPSYSPSPYAATIAPVTNSSQVKPSSFHFPMLARTLDQLCRVSGLPLLPRSTAEIPCYMDTPRSSSSNPTPTIVGTTSTHCNFSKSRGHLLLQVSPCTSPPACQLRVSYNQESYAIRFLLIKGHSKES